MTPSTTGSIPRSRPLPPPAGARARSALLAAAALAAGLVWIIVWNERQQEPSTVARVISLAAQMSGL